MILFSTWRCSLQSWKVITLIHKERFCPFSKSNMKSRNLKLNIFNFSIFLYKDFPGFPWASHRAYFFKAFRVSKKPMFYNLKKNLKKNVIKLLTRYFVSTSNNLCWNLQKINHSRMLETKNLCNAFHTSVEPMTKWLFKVSNKVVQRIGPCQTSMMKFFAKTVNFQLLTIFTKKNKFDRDLESFSFVLL